MLSCKSYLIMNRNYNIFPRNIRYFVFSLLLLAVGLYFYFSRSEDLAGNSFILQNVKRGDIHLSISATGTVEPEEVVDVGAQVAGLILSFGSDINGKTIDYGSVVEEGTVLAEIDKSLYQSDVSQAQAQVQRAKADVLLAEAKFRQAQRDWKRAEGIGASEALSQTSFDAYKANFESASANLEVAKAAVLQSEAVLAKAQRNLSLCTIKSPVKGVIIDRRVNIGQTVVSSLNAPSLFLIAKDLHRMQVWVSVNEADVGNIHPGQRVTFSVDAFPEQEFVGEVGKLRLNATMSQNVVTYVVEVLTDNSSGKLLPYLTANANFEVASRSNVLLVPNAALRFTPSEEKVATKYLNEYNAGKNKSTNDKYSTQQGTVWLVEGRLAKPIKVNIGGTDAVNTEIVSDVLKEGDQVIVGQQENNSSSDNTASTASPFTPKMARGRRSS